MILIAEAFRVRAQTKQQRKMNKMVEQQQKQQHLRNLRRAATVRLPKRRQAATAESRRPEAE